MKTITVINQIELDNIPLDFVGEIHIIGMIDTLNKHYPNAEIIVSGNAQIGYVSGNAKITYVYGDAKIRDVCGNAQIGNVYGNAQISDVYGNATVETLGQNIITHYETETNIKIKASPNTAVVVLKKLQPTFDSYKTFYPVNVIDNYAIMYKSVHKIDGKYISNYDKSFEYKIGKTITEKCDESTNESCTNGLHISHKAWALIFGNDWNDMALLEVKVSIDKIVVSTDSDGKIRTSELYVIREVPPTEY